jgi:lysophospholipase L1-like esterase
VALVAAVELASRVARLGEPSFRSQALPEEQSGLMRTDPELFWSLHPGVEIDVKGKHVSVNQLGLRGPEIGPKGTNEFRILSLGESTTFGSKVAEGETYCAFLQTFLAEKIPAKAVKVINGGVPAYSSFQSLKYLELRGLELRPDLVLFYHEVNDYLPSSVRDSQNTEIGLTLTDRQLYESKVHRFSRALMEHSAFFRWCCFRNATHRIHQFNTASFHNPLLLIGLPDIGIDPRMIGSAGKSPALNEASLGRRVSDAERLANLQHLQAFCREHGIPLVVIHPAYRDTTAHECLLTQFCKEHGAVMFDAFPSLHPRNASADSLFLDLWHPTPGGHRLLARDLAAFIFEQVFNRQPGGALLDRGNGDAFQAENSGQIGLASPAALPIFPLRLGAARADAR